MAKYVPDRTALRSWWLVPYACVAGIGTEQRRVRSIRKEEFDLLCLCDGKTDLPESELLSSLLKRKRIRPAKDGETADPFLLPREYENRCVPCMGINITEKCNFNCLHCYEAADNDIPRAEMAFEDCKRLLREARDCGIQNVKITGGEPLMHRDFLKIVRCVYENEMTVDRINTNAFFLTGELVDALREIDPYILFNVSYDGAGYHDWMRGREGAEKDLLEKIRLLVEKGYRVRAAMTLNRVNMKAASETMRRMNDLGVQEFRIIRTSEVPRWVLNAGDACLTMQEYYDAMLELCREYAASDLDIALNIWHFAVLDRKNRWFSLAPVRCAPEAYRPDLPVCPNARGNITVTPDGDVFPCTPSPGLFRAQGIRLGNVFRDGLQKLLQDSPYLSFVCHGVHAVREHDPKCGACRFFEQCQGGCRLFALGLNHDALSHDPTKCLFFEDRYDEKLREICKQFREQ